MKIFDWLIRYLPHKNIQSQIFNFYLNIKFLYKKAEMMRCSLGLVMGESGDIIHAAQPAATINGLVLTAAVGVAHR